MGCAKRALIACKKIARNSALDKYIKEVITLLDMHIKKMENLYKETNRESNMIRDLESFNNLSAVLALIIQELRKETEDHERMFNHDVLVLRSPRFELKIPLWLFTTPAAIISYTMSSNKDSFVITKRSIKLFSKKIRGERDGSAIKRTYDFGDTMFVASYYCGDYDFELPDGALDIIGSSTINQIPDGYDVINFTEENAKDKLDVFSNICDKFK